MTEGVGVRFTGEKEPVEIVRLRRVDMQSASGFGGIIGLTSDDRDRSIRCTVRDGYDSKTELVLPEGGVLIKRRRIANEELVVINFDAKGMPNLEKIYAEQNIGELPANSFSYYKGVAFRALAVAIRELTETPNFDRTDVKNRNPHGLYIQRMIIE